MGRGRQKAKHTKVARDLKYFSPDTNYGALAKELGTPGAAIEIFVNITIYLRSDIIHVKIVMATALMAIARKVIIMDITKIEPLEIFAIASVILALSVGYWLVNTSHGDGVGGDMH